MVDNHLQHGNELGIDPRRIVLRRVIDLNDRALRDIIIGLGGVKHGVPRRDGFNITPASRSHGHPLPGAGLSATWANG